MVRPSCNGFAYVSYIGSVFPAWKNRWLCQWERRKVRTMWCAACLGQSFNRQLQVSAVCVYVQLLFSMLAVLIITIPLTSVLWLFWHTFQPKTWGIIKAFLPTRALFECEERKPPHNTTFSGIKNVTSISYGDMTKYLHLIVGLCELSPECYMADRAACADRALQV